ncbi:hypothetical protein CERSUDRAFT_96284 [Gelatoporia subvermispora B]|uniref:Uncharacterized protein n=1 Tax=Ceriporiopsis subvermispora (strain B) TaxID=914234 RepID=M2QG93_CERS8|nr:hypothetical protein CERSUDRAFT_96284 [Gelatoporia subvermispora B]
MSVSDPPRVSPLSENRKGLCVVSPEDIVSHVTRFHSSAATNTYQEIAPDLPGAAGLLAIILSCNDLYNDVLIQYQDIIFLRGFLQTHKWIQDELESAWKSRDFTKLLQYTFWYNLPEYKGSERPTRGTVMSTERQAEALHTAWAMEYIGVLHILLYNNIMHAFKKGSSLAHANYACLIQGSGSGKSRMIWQLGLLIFSLSFNLRRPEDPTQQMKSYPDPDHELRDHFLRSRSLSYYEQQAFFWTWFLNLFEVILEQIRQFDRQNTYGDLASFWRTTLQKNRSYIYKLVVHRHRNSGNHKGATSRKELQVQVRAALCNLLVGIDSLVTPSAWKEAEERVKIVCSFDEADVLALQKVPKNDKEGNMFEALCSSLNVFRGLPIFFIFLSTNSNIALLAPPKHRSTSNAVRRHFDSLVAPFTETAFDCSPNFPLSHTGYTLKRISTVQFMAQFGRPLWHSLLRGSNAERGRAKGKQQPVPVAKELLDLARVKLIACGDQLHSNNDSGDQDISDRWSPAVRRALADIRVSLVYEPSREKTYDELSTLVASHMRTAFTVPGHREYMRSGYPSEPILAEAAAQELYLLKASDRTKGPTTLAAIAAEALRHDLCSPGERGEVVGRILLTLAYDAAVERAHRESDSSGGPVNYSAGCPLIYFIQELFTQEHAEEILTSLPDNVPITGDESTQEPSRKTFKEAFKNAYVRFTHFGRLGDDGGITTLALFAAFLRGQAQMGHPTQAQIDAAIPVVLKIDNICEKNMTVLLISFKRRLVEGTRAEYNICADSLNVFFHSQEPSFTKRPYVALVMELGVCGRTRYVLGPRHVTGPVKRGETLPLRFPAAADLRTPQSTSKVLLGRHNQALRDLRPSTKQRLHPRYNIYAYGCSERVYKVIDVAERPVYQILLANLDMFDEYARKMLEGSIRGLLRLKPVWYTMVDSYHWIALNDTITKALQIEQANSKKTFVPDVVFAGKDEDVLNALEKQMDACAVNANNTSGAHGRQGEQAQVFQDSQASATAPHDAEPQAGPVPAEEYYKKYAVEFPGGYDSDEEDMLSALGEIFDRNNSRNDGANWEGEGTSQDIVEWSAEKLARIGQGEQPLLESDPFVQDPFKAEDERIQRKLREMLVLEQETIATQLHLSSISENDTEHSQGESPTREAKKRIESRKKVPKDKREGDHSEEKPPKKKITGKGKARAG